MIPPPIAFPSRRAKTTSPVLASKARNEPRRSPASTTPPSVTVTPPSTGADLVRDAVHAGPERCPGVSDQRGGLQLPVSGGCARESTPVRRTRCHTRGGRGVAALDQKTSDTSNSGNGVATG